jgi:hypothetical protein
MEALKKLMLDLASESAKPRTSYTSSNLMVLFTYSIFWDPKYFYATTDPGV